MLIITYISVCILFLVSFYMFIGLLEVSGRQIVLFQQKWEKGVYTRCRNDIAHCVIIKYGSDDFITTNKYCSFCIS